MSLNPTQQALEDLFPEALAVICFVFDEDGLRIVGGSRDNKISPAAAMKQIQDKLIFLKLGARPR